MKKICSLLLALLFACALFGCGDKNPGGDEDGEKTEEPVLTYDSYMLDAYLAPIWKGKIVYNETLLFVGKEDRAPPSLRAERNTFGAFLRPCHGISGGNRLHGGGRLYRAHRKYLHALL